MGVLFFVDYLELSLFLVLELDCEEFDAFGEFSVVITYFRTGFTSSFILNTCFDSCRFAHLIQTRVKLLVRRLKAIDGRKQIRIFFILAI